MPTENENRIFLYICCTTTTTTIVCEKSTQIHSSHTHTFASHAQVKSSAQHFHTHMHNIRHTYTRNVDLAVRNAPMLICDSSVDSVRRSAGNVYLQHGRPSEVHTEKKRKYWALISNRMCHNPMGLGKYVHVQNSKRFRRSKSLFTNL